MPRIATRTALAKRITARGRRLTDQRVIVAQALAAERQAVSAQELHARLHRGHPRVGLATVYRALEAQVEAGMATRLERPGHVSAYVACVPEHHHHLVCTSCQRVDDVDEAILKPVLRGIRERHEFQVDHERLDFYGLCSRCRRERAAL
ncbi:MAG TPA: Fur family transcriptional regulator [Candidatus Limnocylindria bacterium]|jgi:Fe2+ or Zn2+ uptake regulation protein|nr:Fur family transcriptional regulator [Candidatus Limnocylindria bacterium]